MPGRLASDVAFIVGASSGIGRAIATRFASEGATVAVAGLHESSETEDSATHEHINENYGEATFVECDLTEQASIDAAVETAVSAYGQIDIAVNCAGAMTRGPVTQAEEGDIQRVVDVNLMGAIRFAKAILPELVETDGTLITITSEAGERGIENLPIYCASKGGVNTLTKQLAVEYGPKGVNVNAIAPGTTKTAINERVRRENPDWVDERVADIPIGMLNEPEDVAELGVYLASDSAKKVNGEIVNIDGGTTAK